MQPISGPFTPISPTSISGAYTTAGIGGVSGTNATTGTSTLNAVSNIMTALVGNTSAANGVSAAQVINCTMSGALGSSIGTLLKTGDNKLDMSEEEWSQEVLAHQDSTEQLSQDFSQRITQDREQNRIGQSGFAVPGFEDPEMQNLIQGDEE